MDLTHVRPTPDNYAAYTNQRNKRTQEAMANSNRISGSEVKEKNLSVAMICKNGYRYDPYSDMLIKD